MENNNMINHPDYYQGEHECIDIMVKLFGIEAVIGFCKCNSFKYRFRAGNKEGESKEKDIKKAEAYEDMLFNRFVNFGLTDEAIEKGII